MCVEPGMCAISHGHRRDIAQYEYTSTEQENECINCAPGEEPPAGRQTSGQASKQASKQAGKKVGKRASEQAGKDR